MHRPIYTSSASGLDPSSVIRVSEDLRGALEPVFFMYQVMMDFFLPLAQAACPAQQHSFAEEEEHTFALAGGRDAVRA